MEIDGRGSHDIPAAFDRDRTRQNAFVQAGWVVLRFSHDAVARDPEGFVTEVKVALQRLRSDPD